MINPWHLGVASRTTKTSLYFQKPCPFHHGHNEKRKKKAVVTLICISTANHYDCDETARSHATLKGRSSYTKNLEAWDWKINIWIEIFFSWFYQKNWYSHMPSNKIILRGTKFLKMVPIKFFGNLSITMFILKHQFLI